MNDRRILTVKMSTVMCRDVFISELYFKSCFLIFPPSFLPKHAGTVELYFMFLSIFWGVGSGNKSYKEKPSFYSWSVILNYGQNLVPGAPFGQPWTPWESGPPHIGTEEVTLLSVTQLTFLG